MTKIRDPKIQAGQRSARVYLRPAETDQTRLARWPPPYRASENKPVLIKHPPGETPKRAKPRGWRLTRSVFSEFSDD